MGELGAFAKEYVEALNKSLGHIAMICDRDSVIATAGVQKKEYLDHAVSREMEQAMEQRKPILTDRRSGGKPMPITEQDNASQTIAQIVVPVISEGEATGAVVLLSRQEDCKFGETELKVTQTTAGFLGRQLEQ